MSSRTCPALVLAGALLCATARADTAGPPPALQTTVTYTPTPNGQMVVPVQITGADGKTVTMQFVLDSGAGPSVVTDTAAARLGLTPTAGTATNGQPAVVNGLPASTVTVPKMQIGPFVNDHAQYLVVSGDALVKTAGQPVEGILGANILSVMPALVDFQTHRVTFYTPRPLSPAAVAGLGLASAVQIPLQDPLGNYAFTCRVRLTNGDKTADADLQIDTGSTPTLLSGQVADQLGLTPDPAAQTPQLLSLFGTLALSQATVPSLTLADAPALSASSLKVIYTHGPLPSALPPHLGLNVLSQYRVLLDFPEKRMFLSKILPSAKDGANGG